MDGSRQTRAEHASCWLVRARPRPEAPVRLICFPHAGGAASAYFQWVMELEGVDVLSVQLPGREGRIAESPVEDMRILTAELARAIRPVLDRPCAFLGHSMGSLLAFELARELSLGGNPGPDHLIVSGRRAPSIPDTEAPLHPLPAPDLVAELERRFGGLPAVVKAEPDLMALFLPVIRADLKALETHAFEALPKLGIPITAMGGEDDARVTPEGLDAWEELTDGLFDRRLFPGGHFFLHEQRTPVLEAVSAVLRQLASTPETG